MSDAKKTRHENRGLRKLCAHPRRQWAKCSCSWFVNFKWQGRHYRFSLDKHLGGKHLESKSEAEDAAHEIRKAIKAGTFGQAAPAAAPLTMAQLLDHYMTRHVKVERKGSVRNVGYQIALIAGTEIERPDGRRLALGAWPVAEVTTAVIEDFKARRSGAGAVTANRDLSLLRAMFAWACSKKRKLAAENPFRDGDKAAIALTKEHARTPRLQPGEAEALLGACEPHLRGVVEAALETGCRRGELLSLQWSQVEGMRLEAMPSQPGAWQTTWAPQATLLLPGQKTKTKRARRIPISTRLKAILEMRRFDPKGQPHAGAAFVFGNAVGERVASIDRAWQAALLRSRGLTPAYTKTANLTAESRAALRAIDLHFHDLRREAGSRWLDGGMPLHAVRDLLGHSNVSQTSTYLSTTSASLHDAMQRFETRLQRIATEDGTGGQEAPQTAATGDERPNEHAVGRGLPIM